MSTHRVTPPASIIAIKKTGEDNYIVNIQEKHIDYEEVDGPKLLAMLGKEELLETTADDVVGQLDFLEIGEEVRVRFKLGL
jgi:hypothetical protein